MLKFLALVFVLHTCNCQYILNSPLNGLRGQIIALAPQSLGALTTSTLSPQSIIVLQAAPQSIALAPQPLALAAQPIALAPYRAPAIAVRAPPPVIVQPAPRPVVLQAPPRPVVLQAAPRPVATAVAEENYGPAEPYNFGYQTQDEHGNSVSRQESSDGAGTVRGSYSYTDIQGLNRIVEYIADAGGYRATVKTNEPGTANANPADVQITAEEPPAGVVAAYANPPKRVQK